MATRSVTRKTKALVTSQSLVTEFERCCKEYQSLHIAVAWCSDPKKAPVFGLLKGFRDNLTATVGIALAHTHPDAIEWFRHRAANVRVVRDEILFFHPKVYLFISGEHYAAFVGSSNLTHGGFYANAEVNILIEGTFEGGKGEDIRGLQRTLEKWHSPDYSFEPTDEWLEDYKNRYWTADARAERAGVPTPPVREEAATSAGWLGTANWPTYYRRVLEGLRQNGRTARQYHDVLDASAAELPVPWSVAYFDEKEKRRIMNGTSQYGWLGHVGSRGMFRKLLANGSTQERQTIVDAINCIATFNHPIEWNALEAELNRLTHLKFRMNFWGRFLCLVRPDLYCTVASESVRANLSETLKVARSAFFDPAGYIQLLKLVHSSPWFLSTKPKESSEAAVWQRRVAFMDPIFY